MCNVLMVFPGREQPRFLTVICLLCIYGMRRTEDVGALNLDASTILPWAVKPAVRLRSTRQGASGWARWITGGFVVHAAGRRLAGGPTR